jgi:hypothetical protein
MTGRTLVVGSPMLDMPKGMGHTEDSPPDQWLGVRLQVHFGKQYALKSLIMYNLSAHTAASVTVLSEPAALPTVSAVCWWIHRVIQPSIQRPIHAHTSSHESSHSDNECIHLTVELNSDTNPYINMHSVNPRKSD